MCFLLLKILNENCLLYSCVASLLCCCWSSTSLKMNLYIGSGRQKQTRIASDPFFFFLRASYFEADFLCSSLVTLTKEILLSGLLFMNKISSALAGALPYRCRALLVLWLSYFVCICVKVCVCRQKKTERYSR